MAKHRLPPGRLCPEAFAGGEGREETPKSNRRSWGREVVKRAQWIPLMPVGSCQGHLAVRALLGEGHQMPRWGPGWAHLAGFCWDRAYAQGQGGRRSPAEVCLRAQLATVHVWGSHGGPTGSRAPPWPRPQGPGTPRRPVGGLVLAWHCGAVVEPLLVRVLGQGSSLVPM